MDECRRYESRRPLHARALSVQPAAPQRKASRHVTHVAYVATSPLHATPAATRYTGGRVPVLGRCCCCCCWVTQPARACKRPHVARRANSKIQYPYIKSRNQSGSSKQGFAAQRAAHTSRQYAEACGATNKQRWCCHVPGVGASSRALTDHRLINDNTLVTWRHFGSCCADSRPVRPARAIAHRHQPACAFGPGALMSHACMVPIKGAPVTPHIWPLGCSLHSPISPLSAAKPPRQPPSPQVPTHHPPTHEQQLCRQALAECPTNSCTPQNPPMLGYTAAAATARGRRSHRRTACQPANLLTTCLLTWPGLGFGHSLDRTGTGSHEDRWHTADTRTRGEAREARRM